MNARRGSRSLQPISLRPHDVCVGLQLALTPQVSFRELAEKVGLSLGEAHNSAKRLEVARILQPHQRVVNSRQLFEFLIYGVPYAFPGQLGHESQGVPTAISGPVLENRIASADSIVWPSLPSLEGSTRGATLAPLCPAAPSMAVRNPALYRLLTLVDALRVGRIRERGIAQDVLSRELVSHVQPE